MKEVVASTEEFIKGNVEKKRWRENRQRRGVEGKQGRKKVTFSGFII